MTLGFRKARSVHPLWNLTKTMIQTVFFWTTFLLVIPHAIVQFESFLGIPTYTFPFQYLIAFVWFVAFSMLGLWSGITMAIYGKGTPLPLDTAQELVIRGPYRFVRNPMAIAGLNQGLAVGVGLGSWLNLVYILVGFILWNWMVRPIEEAELHSRFGSDYEDYCRNIQCWIPKFSKSHSTK